MKIVHFHFTSLSSTNDWAKEHLSSLDRSEMTLITADFQTQGRGSYGKQWVAPAQEALLATYVFIPSKQEEAPLFFTHLLAYAAGEVLRTKGVEPVLKWPNDLLVRGRKIAGILCETVGEWVIVGIGINVNVSQEGLAAVGQEATSLLLETGSSHSIDLLQRDLTDLFLRKLQVL